MELVRPPYARAERCNGIPPHSVHTALGKEAASVAQQAGRTGGSLARSRPTLEEGAGANLIERRVPMSPAISPLPTPEFPGLWICAQPPRATFACACGYTRDVAGRARVSELVTHHQEHADVCVLTTGGACEESARRATRGARDAAGSTRTSPEMPRGQGGNPDLSGEPVPSAA